jgi:hypothetical protein
MADSSRELRQTSDELLRDLEALVTLEDEKRAISPGDPRLVEMAAQIESIATRVLVSTTRQRVLTEDIQDEAEAGGPGAPTDAIDETPRSIPTILAEWRDAERRAAAAQPGSAEAREVEILLDQLRSEYRTAHAEARRRDRS